MTYEEAVKSIPCGRYRHFKGNDYEVIGIARHLETEEPMVVYCALYGDGGLWTRPVEMWLETVERDGKIYRRFEKICRVKAFTMNSFQHFQSGRRNFTKRRREWKT